MLLLLIMFTPHNLLPGVPGGAEPKTGMREAGGDPLLHGVIVVEILLPNLHPGSCYTGLRVLRRHDS